MGLKLEDGIFIVNELQLFFNPQKKWKLIMEQYFLSLDELQYLRREREGNKEIPVKRITR